MTSPFVTVLVARFEVATAFAGRDDESADALRRQRLHSIEATLATHGGRTTRSTGDAVFAAFPSAVDAVRCAAALQQQFAAGLRVGLDAGEPLPDGDDLHGTPVVVAERLCDSATPGEILVTDTVARIAAPRVANALQPVGALRLLGIDERVSTTRVVWAEPPSDEPEPTTPARRISVVIADDQRLIRAGFRVILESEPDLSVVGEAQDGRAALDLIRRVQPDVALLDIRMPEMSGLDVTEHLLADPGARTAVLLLTTFDSSEYVYRAIRAGASGFLLKDAPADRLLDAIRVVAAGDALLAPSITRRLIGHFARGPHHEAGHTPERLADLTARELDVMRLVARGLSNAEIADELVLGETTIKTHVANGLGKLGLRDRVQMVVLAYETGLVAPEGNA